MDFSQEELVETIDRLVAGLIERAGVTAGPVNALALAEHHLGIPVQFVEPAEEDESGRRRPRSRPAGNGITLTTDMSDEQRQRAAAGGIALLLMPEIFRKLSVPLGSESKQFQAHVRGLVVPRVLIPSRLFRAALRDCKYDVPALKQVFSTASMEMVAARLLDLDAPCVIAVVDDGVVASRRGNRAPAARKLEAAEQECVDRVTELDLPHRARVGEWTAWGWPVPDRPFRRILLRAVPDDV
ncbi:Uncharacterized protein OS=Planctomyces brasiliensis (strain ATCC 49424 / DSM 5305 / JCM 21570 / NBRC 103401 / IFAM 1448) GN=Plabr_2240 PE=4 SV=1 [Gemmata massiliana]|uniref:Uncharacterized protein n=1 Tax=Gemmata massiliana TaxID=1210884 RepID=A0A6P2CV41_9BACT|nr:hypothetical protein [Gemmata massiliana]VTR92246.1 Uncharacterized protein OS=Planctomyces brasiliensis (strain ATCC 49424 / DSM 5305 / JCM 21570 / NBRC 103401 / IFAM 1448) GN=Plabr_2240 PE=4 SV=1 [Gemmata massiliana]